MIWRSGRSFLAMRGWVGGGCGRLGGVARGVPRAKMVEINRKSSLVVKSWEMVGNV